MNVYFLKALNRYVFYSNPKHYTIFKVSLDYFLQIQNECSVLMTGLYDALHETDSTQTDVM